MNCEPMMPTRTGLLMAVKSCFLAHVGKRTGVGQFLFAKSGTPRLRSVRNLLIEIAPYAHRLAKGERRARCVLDCGSPLPLSARPALTKSARGLAQSKTLALSLCFWKGRESLSLLREKNRQRSRSE